MIPQPYLHPDFGKLSKRFPTRVGDDRVLRLVTRRLGEQHGASPPRHATELQQHALQQQQQQQQRMLANRASHGGPGSAHFSSGLGGGGGGGKSIGETHLETKKKKTYLG